MQDCWSVLCAAWEKERKSNFSGLQCPLQRHEDFGIEGHSEHHKRKTIVADLDIDLVADVVLDYMHLTCLGVMRKLLCYWIKRDAVNHLIEKNAPTIISSRLTDLRKYVPGEFGTTAAITV